MLNISIITWFRAKSFKLGQVKWPSYFHAISYSCTDMMEYFLQLDLKYIDDDSTFKIGSSMFGASYYLSGTCFQSGYTRTYRRMLGKLDRCLANSRSYWAEKLPAKLFSLFPSQSLLVIRETFIHRGHIFLVLLYLEHLVQTLHILIILFSYFWIQKKNRG